MLFKSTQYFGTSYKNTLNPGNYRESSINIFRMKYGVVDFPQKGKGLIALEDCEEDETLFSEEPICSAQMAWGRKLNYKEILAF